MSDMEDGYLLRIADYLDGKMSPSEEEGFIRDVGENEVLRALFEEELLVGSLLGAAPEKAAAAPVAPVRRLSPYRIAAAAAILVLLAGAGIYIATMNHAPVTPVASLPAKPDTTSATVAVAPRPDGPALFARYAQPYDGTKDPVEVSYYYNQYRKGRYADVLGAKPEDFQVMGANEPRNALLRRYMQLYKGLCWLDKGEPRKARLSLDSAWKSSGPGEAISYTAQWYSLMAALKEGDRAGITDLAGRLSRRPNPYQDRARKILRDLL